MFDYLFYCRANYEADLLAELDDKLSQKNKFGYANFAKDKGFIQYHLSGHANQRDKSQSKSRLDLNGAKKALKQMPLLQDLMFARQKCLLLGTLSFTDLQDRIGELLEYLPTLVCDSLVFGDVMVEHPDTEAGKQVAKFCKKITVPLRAALRKQKRLSTKQNASLPYLHVFFEDGKRCLIALSVKGDRSEHLLGVKRLKFPTDAPSRSTLKLEEAINEFCQAQQQEALFQSGMTAVDLGACPGGWTYQLVSRGIRVEAVDNGAMDEALMQTGLVDYFAADGFTYRPKDGHVDWLVCDMIEQPDRVAKLMIQWLREQKASAAIFNLKLPMKKRYQTLAPLMKAFQSLNTAEQGAYIRAKHLYHNRDEVTFFILKNSQMCEEMLS